MIAATGITWWQLILITVFVLMVIRLKLSHWRAGHTQQTPVYSPSNLSSPAGNGVGVTHPNQASGSRSRSGFPMIVAGLIFFAAAGLFFISAVIRPRNDSAVVLNNSPSSLQELDEDTVFEPMETSAAHRSNTERIKSTMRSLNDARMKLQEAVKPLREIPISDLSNALSSPEDIEKILRKGGTDGSLNVESGISDTKVGAENGGVVVVELTPENLAAIMGQSNSLLISSLKQRLPQNLRQTYALIPLTIPGTLVPSASKSIDAAEALRELALTLASVLKEKAEKPETAAVASVPAAEPSVSIAPAEQPAEPAPLAPKPPQTTWLAEMSDTSGSGTEPGWVSSPDGGRIVVETTFMASRGEAAQALSDSVNKALVQHLQEQSLVSIRPPADWTRLLKPALSDSALKQCVLETYERHEVLETRDGPQPMYKTYALVAFPEAVDNAVLASIRTEVQKQRASIVGLVMLLIWAAIMSSGLIIRFTGTGGRIRKLMGLGAMAVITIPLLMATIGVTVEASRGEVFDFPWQSTGQRITFDSELVDNNTPEPPRSSH